MNVHFEVFFFQHYPKEGPKKIMIIPSNPDFAPPAFVMLFFLSGDMNPKLIIFYLGRMWVSKNRGFPPKSSVKK